MQTRLPDLQEPGHHAGGQQRLLSAAGHVGRTLPEAAKDWVPPAVLPESQVCDIRAGDP